MEQIEGNEEVKEKSYNIGCGLTFHLFFILTILKVAKIIDWSWWWIIGIPIFGPFIVLAIIFYGVVIIRTIQNLKNKES